MANKHSGSKFDDYLLESLKEDDQMVFLYIREALANPNLDKTDDYLYLIEAIKDVARARGKSDLALKAGISRQALHKILNGESIPSIQNIMAILNAIGLRFSVAQISKVVSADDPANVLDVAKYASRFLPRNATFMQLQKIIYYAQVESLINYKKRLFKEPIEAWAAGPVVRELYNMHRGLRYINDITFGNENNLSLEQKTCVDWAIERYGKLDGDTLSHLTHLEKPWIDARGGLPDDAPCDQEITIDSMIDYYSSLPNYSELDDKEQTNY